MEFQKRVIDDLESSLLTLNYAEAESIIKSAAESGSSIDVMSDLISKSLQRIGEAWEEGVGSSFYFTLPGKPYSKKKLKSYNFQN